MVKASLLHDIKRLDIDIFRGITRRYKKMNLDLTPMHAKILLRLNESDKLLCQKDLEEFISCNKSTLSSIISTMEKNDLLTREVSKQDSRINYLVVSEKGKELINFLKEDQLILEDIINEGITDDEYQTFSKIVDKVRKNIERI